MRQLRRSASFRAWENTGSQVLPWGRGRLQSKASQPHNEEDPPFNQLASIAADEHPDDFAELAQPCRRDRARVEEQRVAHAASRTLRFGLARGPDGTAYDRACRR